MLLGGGWGWFCFFFVVWCIIYNFNKLFRYLFNRKEFEVNNCLSYKSNVLNYFRIGVFWV